ncbi:hypothetical protein D3C71_1110130 [compost metagenome]
MPRYGCQDCSVLRAAEELVQRLFRLAERGAQFVHHTAHGLVVADPAVQLFHPLLERFWLRARPHRIQALCQSARADFHLIAVRIQLFKGCLQIQDRGGYFHGQRGRRRFTRAGGGFQRAGQRLSEAFATGVQLAQRVADQTELVRRWLELVAVAARQGRPGFRGSSYSLACLRQHGRIKPAKTGCFIVHRLEPIKGKSLPDRLQRRSSTVIGFGWLGLRTEEQQILNQAVCNRRVTLGKGGVLHQHAGCHTLDVDVCRQKAGAESLKKACAYLPESAGLAVLLGCHKSQAGIPQTQRSPEIAGFDDS